MENAKQETIKVNFNDLSSVAQALMLRGQSLMRESSALANAVNEKMRREEDPGMQEHEAATLSRVLQTQCDLALLMVSVGVLIGKTAEARNKRVSVFTDFKGRVM